MVSVLTSKFGPHSESALRAPVLGLTGLHTHTLTQSLSPPSFSHAHMHLSLSPSSPPAPMRAGWGLVPRRSPLRAVNQRAAAPPLDVRRRLPSMWRVSDAAVRLCVYVISSCVCVCSPSVAWAAVRVSRRLCPSPTTKLLNHCH